MAKLILAGITVTVLTLAVPSNAQTEAASPELRALARYLGAWTYQGRDYTPVTGGDVTCTSTRRWIAGGNFVESDRSCRTPNGAIEQVEVFGYDFSNRLFTYWGFNGRTVSNYAATSLDGDSVVWTGFGPSAGNRCTEVLAPDRRTLSDRCETSRDGGVTWILRSGGTLTKGS